MVRFIGWLAAVGLFVAAPAAKAEFLVGLTGANFLVRFDSATPGTTVNNVAISGLFGGDTPLGIDYRPSTGTLYLLARSSGAGGLNPGPGRVYTVDPITGIASNPVALTAGGLSFTLTGGLGFGVDFNPVPDRLRVINDGGQNLRINVDTGVVITDTPVSGATITGSAYTNNFPGATLTTLYGIDPNTDFLVTTATPNNGASYGNVGAGLGVNATTLGGFDIGGSGVAYAVFNTGTGGSANLYTINLATGTASLALQR